MVNIGPISVTHRIGRQFHIYPWLININGGAALVDAGLSTVSLNAAMVGRFHMFGVLIIPFLMIAMTFV